MPSYIFDVVIIAVLAFFAWQGARKGLILTLCGLAAVFVAFFGAKFVSSTFCGPVSNIIRPMIVQTIEGAIKDPSADPEASAGIGGPLTGVGTATAAPIPGSDAEGADPQQSSLTLKALMEHIKDIPIFKGIYNVLQEAVDSGEVKPTAAQTPVDALAGYIAMGISKTVLFGLTFLAIALGWLLLSRALDLAFKLPILAQINLLGGLVLGLIEAALVIIVVVWLGQAFNWIPAEPESPLLKLFTVEKLWELWRDLPI